MSSRRHSPTFWMVLLVIAAILVPTTLAASRGHRTLSTQNTYNDHRAPRPVSSLDVASADAGSVNGSQDGDSSGWLGGRESGALGSPTKLAQGATIQDSTGDTGPL